MDNFRAEIGQPRTSDWLTVDQAMIDAFADVTDDHQFIHTDPVRAAATPFGGTIAHGFLLLSLLPRLADRVEPPPKMTMGVNYGFERIRFVSPVRSGSRIRGVTTLESLEEKSAGQFLSTFAVTVEIEGQDKPALIATWLIQTFHEI